MISVESDQFNTVVFQKQESECVMVVLYLILSLTVIQTL